MQLKQSLITSVGQVLEIASKPCVGYQSVVLRVLHNQDSQARIFKIPDCHMQRVFSNSWGKSEQKTAGSLPVLSGNLRIPSRVLKKEPKLAGSLILICF
jgi:hypothetical protein